MTTNAKNTSDEPQWTDRLRPRSSRPHSRRANNHRVIAGEADWEMESSGPHIPLYTPSSTNKKKTENGEDEEDEVHQICICVQFALQPNRSNLRGDYGNVALLLLLYLLQGIPLGLSASIPMMLQSRHISYHQQALFSFAFWPFR